MAKKRVDPAEFRAKIVELTRSEKNANAIAREYEISRQSIINLLKQDDLDAGRRTDGIGIGPESGARDNCGFPPNRATARDPIYTPTDSVTFASSAVIFAACA